MHYRARGSGADGKALLLHGQDGCSAPTITLGDMLERPRTFVNLELDSLQS